MARRNGFSDSFLRCYPAAALFWGAEFEQAGRDLLAEQADVGFGVLWLKPALAEEQQMADPAHTLVERLQLG